MKSLRKAYRGERGFTLVELLVVVVILGVLAAVATLAVTRFMGSGNLEAAKTELHQAQTAIVACMAAAGASQLDGAVDDWDGSQASSPRVTVGDDVYYASDYLMGAAFKATYAVAQNGEITGGAVLEPGGWSGIAWDPATNGWVAT